MCLSQGDKSIKFKLGEAKEARQAAKEAFYYDFHPVVDAAWEQVKQCQPTRLVIRDLPVDGGGSTRLPDPDGDGMVVEEVTTESSVLGSRDKEYPSDVTLPDVEGNDAIWSQYSIPQRSLWVWESFLKELKSLLSLRLSGCDIGPEGVKFIAEGLRTARNLESLSLSGCSARWQGAEALGNALAQNESLLELDLSDNQLGARGVKSLVQNGLQSNERLTRLSLAGNRIGAKGVEALGALLEAKGSGRGAVVEINLSRNHLEFRDIRRLGTSLREDQSLQILDLSLNELRSDAIYRLGSVALAHSEMRRLDMRGRRVASTTAERIIEKGRTKRCEILMGPLDYPPSRGPF